MAFFRFSSNNTIYGLYYRLYIGIRKWTLEISNFFLPRPIRLKLSANLSHSIWNHYEWKFWLSTPSEWFKTAGGQNSWFYDKTSCMAIIGIKLIVRIRRLHFRSSWVIWMTSYTNYDVMSGDLFARKFHEIVIKLNCGFFWKMIRTTIQFLIKIQFIAYLAVFIDLLAWFEIE